MVIFIKKLIWVVKSLIFGVLIILLFNYIGQSFNMNVPLNIYTIIFIGFLRVPGLCAIIILLNYL